MVDSKNYKACKDMTVRPECLGLEVLLSPFLQHITTQRGAMFCSNIAQAVIIDGREHPRIYTGWEGIVGKYEWGEDREDDATVFANIPKYVVGVGEDPIHVVPENTIIYTFGDTASYMVERTYQPGHFGYKLNKRNTTMLTEGNFMPKDEKYTTSPAHDGNKYMLGTNANVAYMSIPYDTEDAFVVSESLAKKLSHYAIETYTCDIGLDDIPLNLYGNDLFYKAFPDVGDIVRNDAVLMAIRKPRGVGYIADISAEALANIQYLHDDLITTHPGAEVLDVDVHIKSSALAGVKDTTVYAQFLKYYEQLHRYNQKIIDAYKRLDADRFKLTPKLNTLITQAMLLEKERFDKKMRLTNKKEDIEFIHIEITVGYKRNIDKAFKVTGREGGKGVISTVWPDDKMPVDKHGIRADLIVSPDSPFNRMNTSQNAEQFINRAAEIMRQRLVSGELGNTTKGSYKVVMEFIHDIRPVYAEMIQDRIKTDVDMEHFLEDIRNEGFYFHIPPYADMDLEHRIPFIEKKYKIHDEHVTYYVPGKNGEWLKKISKKTICIGSKYVYLLGKIPLEMMTGTEFGYVSQFNTPTKSKSRRAKQSSPVKSTPIRMGEDETSVLTMSIGSEEVFRMMSLYANSPDAVRELQRKLLTEEYPTRLNQIDISTKELVDKNINVSLMKHMLGILGVTYEDVPSDK